MDEHPWQLQDDFEGLNSYEVSGRGFKDIGMEDRNLLSCVYLVGTCETVNELVFERGRFREVLKLKSFDLSIKPVSMPI